MYDFLVGLGELLLKHKFSLSLIGGFLILVLKQRPSKRWLKKHFPRLRYGDEDIIHYEARQIRIESKIDALARHMEVPGWGAHSAQVSQSPSATDGQGSNSSPSWMARVRALIIGAFTMQTVHSNHLKAKGENSKMKKFTSRKFILAVTGAILIVLNDGLDLGIDSETVLAFAGLLAVWITGESAVDAKKAGNGFDETKTH